MLLAVGETSSTLEGQGGVVHLPRSRVDLFEGGIHPANLREIAVQCRQSRGSTVRFEVKFKNWYRRWRVRVRRPQVGLV